jgi:hypothetical protein
MGRSSKMSKNKRSRDQETTVSLSKGYTQSNVGTPPKDSSKGSDYTWTGHAVTHSNNDSSGKKKQRTNNSKKHIS